jgi:hypothetical protein
MPSTRPAVRAIARAIVPEASALDESGWTSFERLVEAALSSRPPRMVRQLRAFLKLLGVFARLRYGRGLAELAPPHVRHLLERLSASRVLLLRRGVWGLRTLVLLGYYADAHRAAAIGYQASAAGWSARR